MTFSRPPHAGSLDKKKGYQPIVELGRGGMGVATLAVFKGPEAFVKLAVLKRMHSDLVEDEHTRKMFLEEARIIAQLSHPNVVQVYEVTLEAGVPTIVMEYLEGKSLHALLRCGSRPLPQLCSLWILSQALSGLAAAHKMTAYDGSPLNVVHRDVSPQNIYVCYNGLVKVLDFGIAKIASSDEETSPGTLRGKVRYMAPEQVSGQRVSPRTDLFALGVILFECVMGQRYWKGVGKPDILQRLLRGQLPDLGQIAIPRLRAICQRALAVRPDDRYSTAEEFREELYDFIESQQGAPESLLLDYLGQEFADERKATQDLIASHITRVSGPPGPRTTLFPQDNIPAGSREANGLEATARLDEPQKTGGHFAPGLFSERTLSSSRSASNTRWAPFALALFALGLSAGFLTLVFAAPKAARLETIKSSSCASGTKSCGGACVSVLRPEFGCDRASCGPCSTANATSRCNHDGQCDVAVCHRGFRDCDGDQRNGCEVDLSTDVENCGSCGQACPVAAHGKVACGDGCKIWRCDLGYEDCNQDASDGCETNVRSAREHCGSCLQACSGTEECRQGQCKL